MSPVMVIISPDVPVVALASALAQAGIVGRFDRDRGMLVIEPAPQRCPECGGTGYDEDARCEFCDGTGWEDGSRG